MPSIQNNVFRFTYTNGIGKPCVGFVELEYVAAVNFSINREDQEIAFIVFPFSHQELQQYEDKTSNPRKPVIKERAMHTPYSLVIKDEEQVAMLKAWYEAKAGAIEV
jgi:hypothetical protein